MSAMEDKAHPVDLTVDKPAREFRVEWASGEKSAYGFDYLGQLSVRARTVRRSARSARETPSPSSRGRAAPPSSKTPRWWGATRSTSSGGAAAAPASIRSIILYEIAPGRAEGSRGGEG